MRIPCLLLGCLLPIGHAFAAVPQAETDVASKVPLRVRCESLNARWRLCNVPGEGEARLLRQISKQACVRNHSWGEDDRGVWVARGCRGEFARVSDAETNAGGARTVRCESTDGLRRHCAVDTRGGVVLTEQLSGMPCELGNSWGFDDGGVWVSLGCRGEFTLHPTTDPPPGFWRRVTGRDHGSDVPGEGQPLRCESRNGEPGKCRLPVSGHVELVRRLSRAACVEGSSWGWSEGQLWVKDGCRAEFMAWPKPR